MSSRDFSQTVGNEKEAIDAFIEKHFNVVPEKEPGIVFQLARGLVLRPAKRIRPILFKKTLEGLGTIGDEKAMKVCLSMELLQGYLLIHDDIIDNADVRRGGPAVHKALENLDVSGTKDAEKTARDLAILAGDYLESQALVHLAGSGFPETSLLKAVQLYGTIITDVIEGQILDITLEKRGAGTLEQVLEVHEKKTAAYTTMLPMKLGAILADREDLLSHMEHFALPLGVAFQVRDDILGTWGDQKKTGKPGHGDLAEGKVNYPVAWAMENTSLFDGLPYPLPRDASSKEVAALAEKLEDSGAREGSMVRYAKMEKKAFEALEHLPFSHDARTFFEGLLEYLRLREI